MSDEPLFKDADAEEAEYAPQQLPRGSAGEQKADLEEGDIDVTPGVGRIIPGAASWPAGGLSGNIGATGGGIPTVGPEDSGAARDSDLPIDRDSGVAPERDRAATSDTSE